MSKQASIVFTIILFALLGVVIIILLPLFNPEPEIEISKDQEINQDKVASLESKQAKEETVSPPEVTNKYLEEIKSVFSDIDDIVVVLTNEDEEEVNDNNLQITRTSKDLVKDQLTNINVPSQYRDFHLSLFLLLSQIDSYLELGETDQIPSIDSEWIRLKNNFDWLRNQVDK